MGGFNVKARDTNGNSLGFDCYWLKKEVWPGYPYTVFAGQPSSDYKYLGWSYSSSGSDVIDEDDSHGMTLKQYNNYTTIYAVYQKIYIITLNTSPAEGGYITADSGSTGAISRAKYGAGEHFQFYARPNSGYDFSHWSVSSGSYTTTMNPPSDGYADRNETWTAHFEKQAPVTYTLTYTKYDDNTGDPPGAQTFQPNVTEVTIQGKNTLAKPSTSINLSYTITFNPNGGSTKKPSEISTRKRTTNYKFEGWTATKNGTEVQYTAGKSYKFGQGNKTLYPVWAVSGTSDAANTGVKVPTAAQCTRPGYKLLGFKAANSSEIVDYAPGASTGADFKSSTTLYAVWELITYSITWVLNGGS